MEVTSNRGTPNSSILIGFSIINQQFWGIPIYGTPQSISYTYLEILIKNMLNILKLGFVLKNDEQIPLPHRFPIFGVFCQGHEHTMRQIAALPALKGCEPVLRLPTTTGPWWVRHGLIVK